VIDCKRAVVAASSFPRSPVGTQREKQVSTQSVGIRDINKQAYIFKIFFGVEFSRVWLVNMDLCAVYAAARE
jgi:hypothetical protein